MGNLPYWLAAFYLQGIGPRTIFKWLNNFPSIAHIFSASYEELSAAGLSVAQINLIKNVDWKKIDNDLKWMEQPSHHIIHYEDKAYPALLKEIEDPPLVLFLIGNKTLLTQAQLAMVGARNASNYGMANAVHFAQCLAESGLVITSGLALGIDASSHQGALAARQGKTIAVFGTGLQHIYPSSHKVLAKKIMESDGLIMSEFSLGTKAYPHNFPRRNRIIAGLSLGVLVVEAALRSGSLITARLGAEYGREVFAIPGSIHHPLAKGCHHLIRQGAKLIETATDILEELGPLYYASQQAVSKEQEESAHLTANLPSSHVQILSYINHEITPLDVIILRSGLTTSEVSSILLTLELDGYIQSVSGGYNRIFANQ